MNNSLLFSTPLAELNQPSAAMQWLILLVVVVIGGVVGLILGKLLTPKNLPYIELEDEGDLEIKQVKGNTPAVAGSKKLPREVMIAIMASVYTTLGAKARVHAVNADHKGHGVGHFWGHWGMEGRRQIFQSHKVR